MLFAKKIFKLSKNRSFNYVPRFYDEDKEKLEERIKMAKERKEGSADGMKARVSAGLSMGLNKHKVEASFQKKQIWRSNTIVFGLIIVLGVLTFYLLTVYLPLFLK